MAEGEQPSIEFRIDDGLVPGAYSNLVNVWHTPYEFTLDFGVIEPVAQGQDGFPVIPVRVSSRVRLPIAVVYPLLRALSDNMAKYEAAHGALPTGTDVNLPPEFRPPTEGEG